MGILRHIALLAGVAFTLTVSYGRPPQNLKFPATDDDSVSAPLPSLVPDTATLPKISGRERVGLVLSGGGAKGIAHVGVIKALEENDIPIDASSR